MKSRRSSWLLLLLLAGCGANTTPTDAPQAAPSANDAPWPGPRCWDPAQDRAGSFDPPASNAERLVNRAIEQELLELQQAIGQYARGARPFYTGTLAVEERREGGDPPRTSSLPEGAVWALLLREPAYSIQPPPEWLQLVIVSEGQQRTLVVSQKRDDPVQSAFSAVSPFGTSAGPQTRCERCLASFAGAPARFDLDVMTHGESGMYVAGTLQPFAVSSRVRAALKRVPPGELALEQIARAHRFDPHAPDDLLAPLVAGEGELTADRSGTTVESADDERRRAPPGLTKCSRSASYTARWRVDERCIGSYRVSDVMLGPIRTECCQDQPGPPRDHPPHCEALP